MKKQVRVTFLPEGRATVVPQGASIAAAVNIAGIALYAPCGNRGICGKCKVQVTNGTLPALTAAEKRFLMGSEIAEGWRLACQTSLLGDATVVLPGRGIQMALIAAGGTVQPSPNVRKVYVTLPKPSLEDQRDDLTRLRDALAERVGQFAIGLEVVRGLPQGMWSHTSGITAVLVGGECIALEEGDTTQSNYGVAFDIGTTTVVGMLVNLNTGEQVAIASALNGQANYGADIISRLSLVMKEPDGLETLRNRIVETINGVLDDLIQQAQVPREHIYEMTTVGNTCMQHLFLGIDPSAIATSPFPPVVTEPVTAKSSYLGIRINPNGRITTAPNVAGYVGGDTVGVILATGLHHGSEIQLAIDIGTNGEIVLGSEERVLACAAAAGPAFEGAQISMGMRAAEGAIERVWIEDDSVRLRVIGETEPRGICGSGLIDAVAEMLRVGIIDRTGRMLTREEAEQKLSLGLAARVLELDGMRTFVLTKQDAHPVSITQRDMRELQLAKGAITAGITILAKELGISQDQIGHVLLAGAFGSYINPLSARAIGLIPWLPAERLLSVGNAAGAGSRMSLVSLDARQEAVEISRMVQYVELSSRRDFQEEFAAAIYFPPPEGVGVKPRQVRTSPPLNEEEL